MRPFNQQAVASLDVIKIPGLAIREHTFAVPLDHADLDGAGRR
jgi:hypothetical protein